MNFILGFSFFQMMHIQYYGVPVYPNAILLLFTEFGETTATLFQELQLFLIPSLIVIPALIINILCDKRALFLKGNRFLKFLFIFYFIYNPVRTYTTGNTWGRQPSSQEFMGMNIYLSLSYFSGRLLPLKLSKKTTNHKPIPLTIEKTKPENINIIFVLGESLSSNHLSLFNYKRDTTPFLKELKNDKNFKAYKGISAGVSTDVAVAMLMNNTYGLTGRNDVIKGEKCLFKLAKDNEFKTLFYSTQSSQQLRYITNSICPKFIDDFKSLEDIQPNIENENLAQDSLSIDLLPNELDSHFIILHQRGSHSPYALRYQEKNTKFKLEKNYKKDRVNHYDNSVYEFDLFMEKLISKVKTYKKPTLVIYASDHGEGLGEEGVWGHAALKRPSFQIPILFYAHNLNLMNFINELPNEPTQFNLSLLMTQILGYKTSLSFKEHPTDFTILGNDMDGFAGYLETIFENGKLKSYKRKDL